MNLEEKIGCIGAICVVAFLVFMLTLIGLDTAKSCDIRSQCLECGYPDYIVHAGNGYCVRVGSIVVPVDEACPQRVKQGEEKP